MNGKHRLGCVLLLAALWAPATAVSEESTGEVAGIIVDADGKGVENTVVTIAPSRSAAAMTTTTSSPDGRFLLRQVPTGKNLYLKAAKPKSRLGVRAERDDIAVEAGKTTQVGNLQLKIPVRP